MKNLDPTSEEELGLEFNLEEFELLQESGTDSNGASAEVEETPLDDREILDISRQPDLNGASLAIRPVSGRYRGNRLNWQLELRIDVDGGTSTRPVLKRISGDFFRRSGSTTTYFGSFIVNSPVITVTSTMVSIKGLGRFSYSTGYPVVLVKIPRHNVTQPPASSTVTFYKTNNTAGATYICDYESSYFRTVRLEIDRVSDVNSSTFTSYNSGSLPSGGPSRNLSIIRAYAEAGVQMVQTSGRNVVNVSEAGSGATWSNAELHASMVRHFTLWRDNPQWAVWVLEALKHEIGPGLYGIMFDQQGKQRQGCAVFYGGIGGASTTQRRLQLYTYVHELGHCFNLLHSWQKSFATPPGTNRPAALSWMNYPWGYPDGAAMFWSRFPFCFDLKELIHLRHAFWKDIIMGGNNFAVGASLEGDVLPEPISDESGLSFSISAHKSSYALGEPVVLQLKLKATTAQGRQIHTWLHPNFGLVKVAIRKPNGAVVVYEPMIEALVGEKEKFLEQDQEMKDSAYIGYGKDGLYFDEPGRYLVRASYAALDGSEIISDTITVKVQYPINETDTELADLLLGDEQGALFFLLGSDSEVLQNGNEAFDLILDKHSKHDLANYVRLIKGINAGRDFKTVSYMGENISIRQSRNDECVKFLLNVVDANILDPASTQMVLNNLANAQYKTGDEKGFQLTQSKITNFPDKNTKP